MLANFLMALGFYRFLEKEVFREEGADQDFSMSNSPLSQRLLDTLQESSLPREIRGKACGDMARLPYHPISLAILRALCFYQPSKALEYPSRAVECNQLASLLTGGLLLVLSLSLGS